MAIANKAIADITVAAITLSDLDRAIILSTLRTALGRRYK
jgi:hypothetical protein